MTTADLPSLLLVEDDAVLGPLIAELLDRTTGSGWSPTATTASTWG